VITDGVQEEEFVDPTGGGQSAVTGGPKKAGRSGRFCRRPHFSEDSKNV
jgi:hypothetical protein